MELTEDELCLIALCMTEGVGPATVRALRRAAGERAQPLAALLRLGRAELLEIGLRPTAARAVATLESPLLTARARLGHLASRGIRAILQEGDEYPLSLVETLGAEAPPVLFVGGDCSLLDRPAVAVVGSRQPTVTARRAARGLAAGQAGAGLTVVSGGARGIDAAGHAGALQAGATAVVPPAGLLRFRWRWVDTSALSPDAWCAVGQFPPRAGWHAKYALIRNRTVVALSDAVVAFEPRDTGGTWRTALYALRLGKPLFVVSAARRSAKERGLRRLVGMGASALDPGCMPDADEFARLVADYRPPPRPEQGLIFGGRA